MTKKQELATFIAARLDSSEKTQVEIAAEVGFEQANFLSMIRNGKSRIPIGRALALADALDVPRGDLVRRCLDAYEPELYAVLLSVFPGLSMSDDEVEIIRRVRAAGSLPASARKAFAGGPVVPAKRRANDRDPIL